MSDEQPDAVWAPIEPKPSNRKRVWLIVGLVAAALAIVGLLLFLFLPRDEPGAGESPSPSTSESAGPSADPSALPDDEMTAPPVETAPPAADPSLEEFRGRVGVWLEDASRGLDIVTGTTGQEAVSVVEILQEDAQRLADAQPPSSIATEWRDGVSAYAQTLADLRSTVAAGSDSAADVDAARTALAELTGLAGL